MVKQRRSRKALLILVFLLAAAGLYAMADRFRLLDWHIGADRSCNLDEEVVRPVMLAPGTPMHYRKSLVMEFVMHEAGTAEGPVHVIPEGLYARNWDVDREGNIYIIPYKKSEVRKYSGQGKYLNTYELQNRMRAAGSKYKDKWWKLAVGDDGHFFVLPSDYSKYNGIGLYFCPSGGVERIAIEINENSYRFAVVNGCIVQEDVGVVGRIPGAKNVDVGDVQRREWGYKHEDSQERILADTGTLELTGPAGTLTVQPRDVSPYKIKSYEVVGLDEWLNVYVGFCAEDPETRIMRSMAEPDVPGSRYWIGKYDTEGKLLAWITCEPNPHSLSACVAPNGTVFQYWKPQNTNWSAFSRWDPIEGEPSADALAASEMRGQRFARVFPQHVQASPGFSVLSRIEADKKKNLEILSQAVVDESDPELKALWLYMLSMWSEKEESIKWANQLLKEYPEAVFPAAYYEMFLPMKPSEYAITPGRPMKPMVLARSFEFDHASCYSENPDKDPKNRADCISRLREIIDSAEDSDTYMDNISLKLKSYMRLLYVCKEIGDDNCACECALAVEKFPSSQVPIGFYELSGCNTHVESLKAQLTRCKLSAEQKLAIVRRLLFELGDESWGYHAGPGDKYWLWAVGWLDSSDIGLDKKEGLLKEFIDKERKHPEPMFFPLVALGNVAADRGDKKEAEQRYKAAYLLWEQGKVRESLTVPGSFYELVMFLAGGKWEVDGHKFSRVNLNYLWE